MAIDPNTIMQSAVTTVATQKVVKPAVDSAQEVIAPPIERKPPEDYLHEIHLLLVELLAFLKGQSSVSQDLYKFITIYKAGFGPPYIPGHIMGRQHFRFLGGVSVLLNVQAPGIGMFNITTKAAPDWNVVDYPDGTQYFLDASVVANQIIFWQDETDKDVI